MNLKQTACSLFLVFSFVMNPVVASAQSKILLGLPENIYRKMVSDNIISSKEKEILYRNYYNPSPQSFVGHGTLYGSEESSYVELSFFGDVIRQQMQRGFVLSGSGMYGYQDKSENKISEFIRTYYSYKLIDNFILDNQSSISYYYYADGGLERANRDNRNQPIPVTYEKLNKRQQRIYDITSYPSWKIKDYFIATITEQQALGEKASLASGKYIGFVSTKSPNDFGRRFLLYDENGNFAGVVLVTGMAKRSDWTGLEKPTTETFRYYNNPLIIRSSNGTQWGFDLTNKIYKYFGGTGGPTDPIIAVDPDSEDYFGKQ